MTYKFMVRGYNPPAGATEALIGGSGGWVGYSSGSGDWASGDWNWYDTGTRAMQEIQYGQAADGSDIWVKVLNGATSSGRVAHDSLPTQSSDWTAVDVSQNNSYAQGVSNGLPNDDSKASWCVAIRDSRFSYIDDDGDPAVSSNWVKQSGEMSGHLTDVTFNQDSSSPVWVRSNSRFELQSSTDGISFTTRQTALSANCSDVEYSNGVWIAVGAEVHRIGSTNGQTWSALNAPSTRTMYGSAGNGSGNWVIVGETGYVWISSDNGSNWSEAQIPDSRGAGNFTTIRDVAYDGGGIWIAVGEEGEMWKSSDNGSNWSSITPSRGSYGILNTIEFNIL